jgi:hypothetical protein
LSGDSGDHLELGQPTAGNTPAGFEPVRSRPPIEVIRSRYNDQQRLHVVPTSACVFGSDSRHLSSNPRGTSDHAPPGKCLLLFVFRGT